MNKVSIAVIGATASAFSFVANAGIKIEKSEDHQISEKGLENIIDSLSRDDCEDLVNFNDLTKALAEDGKIGSINIESVLAADQTLKLVLKQVYKRLVATVIVIVIVIVTATAQEVGARTIPKRLHYLKPFLHLYEYLV